jgi:3-deoxy-D-manno-octulosonate 8-phosphate phosphatase (KDO 8-P phosphatase)
MNQRMNVLSHFKPIKLIAMDVDGVITDGKILLFESSYQARSMNIKDGYALQLAVNRGYHIMIISGAIDTGAVSNRLKNLGIVDINMGIKDKASLLNERIKELGLQKEQVLFIGDDIPDYQAMTTAGLACCPSDAVTEIKEISHYHSSLKGGEGCVRDIIEKVLKLNNLWFHENQVVSK